ncbi:hypothetical protein ANN_17651 [Periplaneta americana]|uniref:Uncharacterized protein n=1 Tax=Periplaneta americana TaxID=6978 RepID=A0ABQ8SUV4_PERAM|nr:hypothetical protein ANN_17651 [Periplaneta americana]
MAFNLRKLYDKLLPSKETKKCFDCGAEGKVMWQKRSMNKNVPYCLKCSSCHKESAIAVKTWFEHTKLTLAQSLTLIVNHSVEFINSEDSTVYTHTVEIMWGTLKSEVKRKVRESEHDDLYMFEFLYRQMQRRNGQCEAGTIFSNFLGDIGKVYPGYGLETLRPKSYGEFESGPG